MMSFGKLTMVIPDNHTVVFGTKDQSTRYHYCPIPSLPDSFRNAQEMVPDTPHSKRSAEPSRRLHPSNTRSPSHTHPRIPTKPPDRTERIPRTNPI
jgi:hypothetical protein